MFKLFFKVVLIFIVFSLQVQGQTYPTTTTILISIDGFANHYYTNYQPKSLIKLAKNGVKAEALLPTFPTKTFPNHLSLVTGKTPFEHGVILNSFYNKDTDDMYRYGSSKKATQWLIYPPIWVLLEQQNIPTATLFWPESNNSYWGAVSQYALPYDESWSDIQRFDQLYQWLSLPEKSRPKFLSAYFSSIDKAGHKYGTKSTELVTAIRQFDQALSLFLSNLERLDFQVNVIVVSDHGMVDIDKSQPIVIKKLIAGINLDDTVMVNSGTQLVFYQNSPEKVAAIKRQLNEVEDSRFQLFFKGSYPKEWRVPDNGAYIPDIIVNAKPPYIFKADGSYLDKANHGFQPTASSALDALFIASGPSFNQGIEVEAFHNTYVFEILRSLYMPSPLTKDPAQTGVISQIIQ